MLQDLLPASGVRYFRFQPTLPSSVSLDETDVAKLIELQATPMTMPRGGTGGLLAAS